MRALERVVWSEGMHLAQHHFQAQSAYFEGVIGAALSALFQAPYGLLGVQFDDEALLNGTAALVSAQGIMPDGLPFNFPDVAVPEPLAVADRFSPTQTAQLLLLGVPDHAPGRANCATDEPARQRMRFSMVQRPVPDETTGVDERSVAFARKNFRLLLESDVADGLVTLPIARIRRDRAGHFVYDDGYIGPCLRVAANRRLRELVARVAEMLESRAAAVRGDRAGAAGAEYAPREVSAFWFLHALNSSIPALHHVLRTGATHPEQLYLQLVQLAGALCTFSVTSHPRELPAYDHDAPEQCFALLERHIRQHLDVILPAAAIDLALEPDAPSFYVANVTDPRCFAPAARWFLGIRSSMPAGDLVARTNRLIKLCSAKFITRLVQEAYPGLGLDHVPVPPPDLSPRIGTHYFAIRRTEPCWKSIVDSGAIGLYVPDSLPQAELELKVVLETDS